MKIFSLFFLFFFSQKLAASKTPKDMWAEIRDDDDLIEGCVYPIETSDAMFRYFGWVRVLDVVRAGISVGLFYNIGTLLI